MTIKFSLEQTAMERRDHTPKAVHQAIECLYTTYNIPCFPKMAFWLSIDAFQEFIQ